MLAVLLSPATAVSASEPDPSDIRYTATYAPLEDSGPVPHGARPQHLLLAVPQVRGHLAVNYHDVTHNECVTHGNSAGKPERVKNHFALCRRGTVQVVAVDVETGTPVGTLTYVETIIGYAFQGELSVLFE